MAEEKRQKNSFNMADAVSLKEYFESRLNGVEKAIELANDSLCKRLEGMNEFREALKDQTGKMATREEIKHQIAVADNRIDSIRRELVDKAKNLEDKVDSLSYFKASLEGKASQTQANVVMFLSIVGLIISIISLVSK